MPLFKKRREQIQKLIFSRFVERITKEFYENNLCEFEDTEKDEKKSTTEKRLRLVQFYSGVSPENHKKLNELVELLFTPNKGTKAFLVEFFNNFPELTRKLFEYLNHSFFEERVQEIPKLVESLVTKPKSVESLVKKPKLTFKKAVEKVKEFYLDNKKRSKEKKSEEIKQTLEALYKGKELSRGSTKEKGSQGKKTGGGIGWAWHVFQLRRARTEMLKISVETLNWQVGQLGSKIDDFQVEITDLKSEMQKAGDIGALVAEYKERAKKFKVFAEGLSKLEEGEDAPKLVAEHLEAVFGKLQEGIEEVVVTAVKDLQEKIHLMSEFSKLLHQIKSDVEGLRRINNTD